MLRSFQNTEKIRLQTKYIAFLKMHYFKKAGLHMRRIVSSLLICTHLKNLVELYH